MLRVLHSVSNMDRGGIETVLMNYYRHIDREQVQFDFLVNKKKPGAFDEEIRQLGGRIFVSPGVNPVRYGAYQRFMVQLLQEHPEIRILHAHNEAMALFALRGAQRAGLPIRIAHAHNTRTTLNAKWPVKRVCKPFLTDAATDLWACGEDAGIYYFGKDAWHKDGKILPNAIEVERFRFAEDVRQTMRRQYGWENKLVIGHIGRFFWQKNHMRLLQIFAQCVQKVPDAVLLLLGSGGQQELVRKRAIQMGLGDKVFFAGHQTDIIPWLHAMDVFVMPSRHEGMPLAAIEAQANGLPCVLSDGVPAECVLCSQTKRVALSTDDATWVREILLMAKRTQNRQRTVENVRSAGYDVVQEVDKLQTTYLTMAACVERGTCCANGGGNPHQETSWA